MITHRIQREDAVVIGHTPATRRYYVPTTESTVWVRNWEQFRMAGGRASWNEDQTEITLSLPVGHKFSIQFGSGAWMTE